jgi:hypothetical protein
LWGLLFQKKAGGGVIGIKGRTSLLISNKEIIEVTLVLIPSMTSINNEKLMLINEQLICFNFEIILTTLELHKDRSQQMWQGLNFSPWKP